MPGNGTHDHPLGLPALCNCGKQAFCKTADMVALLFGRTEIHQDMLLQGAAVSPYHLQQVFVDRALWQEGTLF